MAVPNFGLNLFVRFVIKFNAASNQYFVYTLTTFIIWLTILSKSIADWMNQMMELNESEMSEWRERKEKWVWSHWNCRMILIHYTTKNCAMDKMYIVHTAKCPRWMYWASDRVRATHIVYTKILVCQPTFVSIIMFSVVFVVCFFCCWLNRYVFSVRVACVY